jgi:hypothetical protein
MRLIQRASLVGKFSPLVLSGLLALTTIGFVYLIMARAQSTDGYAKPAAGPQPPCGGEVSPPYPDLDQPAMTKFWSSAEFGREWKPPTCLGWDTSGFITLVTTVATFRNPMEGVGLLHTFAAISQWKGLRYWSVTHKQWRRLITDGYALTASQNGQHRADFTPDEMKEGNVLYFEQDNNLSGKAIYRMQIVKASDDHVAIKIENVGSIRYLLVPMLHAGDLQSFYFMDRESGDTWRYYSIVRTGKNANRLIGGNDSSAINRAVAVYRHLVGIPDNTEPPAAR